jgi:hypothetical protein
VILSSCAAAGTESCETGTSPWENGYCGSFNSKLRDELLNGEIFYTLKEAKIFIEEWRPHYNTVRPRSSLRYRPPVPEVSATRTSFAGHPSVGAKARHALTSKSDHLKGACQQYGGDCRIHFAKRIR